MIDIHLMLELDGTIRKSIAEFERSLKRSYPNEGRMTHILVTLATWGINIKLKETKFITEKEILNFTKQIEDEFGFSELYAEEALLIWINGMRHNLVIDQSLQSMENPASPIEYKNSTDTTYIQGDESEFEVIQKEDGYYIYRFTGFEEEEMTIPSMINGKKIIGIADHAFKGCAIVKKIIISEGIEVIEHSAFVDCEDLEEVHFPNTLQAIRTDNSSSIFTSSPFRGTRLKEAILPSSLTFLGKCAFKDCYYLKKVVLPDNLSTIPIEAFKACEDLEEVCLPKNLEIIERDAFEECNKLSNITLPEKLCFIGEGAFSKCSIREIYVPAGTKTIGNDAFYKNPLIAIYIPSTVTEIGYREYFKNSANDNGHTFGSLMSDELTIYTTAGSRAMEYARKHSIKCKKAEFK